MILHTLAFMVVYGGSDPRDSLLLSSLMTPFSTATTSTLERPNTTRSQSCKDASLTARQVQPYRTSISLSAPFEHDFTCGITTNTTATWVVRVAPALAQDGQEKQDMQEDLSDCGLIAGSPAPGSCTECCKVVELLTLPSLRSWRQDGGRCEAASPTLT
jgi:hypothetical protein